MEEGLLFGSTEDGVSRRKWSESATPMLIFSTSVVSCGSLAYGFASAEYTGRKVYPSMSAKVGYTSPAESGMMTDLGLSIAQYSVFSSILKFGGMVGAVISGRLSDYFGRRVTMWILETCFILGWILIFFGKNSWWLDIGRILIGIGSAIHCYMGPIYIGEITPKDKRGAFIAFVSFLVIVGFSLMFLLGNFLTWRTLALVGVVPSLVQVIGIFFIPESPRWLAKFGDEKGIEIALRQLRGKDADISSEAAEIIEYAEVVQKEPKSRFLDLFDRRYAHPLIAGVGLMLLVQFGGSDGISSYASSIFEAAGCPAAIGSTMLAITQLPFSCLSILLMDKLGRRTLLMATAATSGFGCFLVGLGFLFKAHDIFKEVTPLLVLTGILINTSSFGAGLGSTPWVVMSEIFPLNIKGTGGSLMTLGNWFGSWLITYVFNFVFVWSSSGVFFILSIICASIIVFVANLVPETKGRTLEEIQGSMLLFK